jgi:hypothetical protein
LNQIRFTTVAIALVVTLFILLGGYFLYDNRTPPSIAILLIFQNTCKTDQMSLKHPWV